MSRDRKALDALLGAAEIYLLELTREITLNSHRNYEVPLTRAPTTLKARGKLLDIIEEIDRGNPGVFG